MFLCSQTWGRLTKLEKEDEPLIVGTGNAGFTDLRDICQNSQDEGETHKRNSVIVLKSALVEETLPSTFPSSFFPNHLWFSGLSFLISLILVTFLTPWYSPILNLLLSALQSSYPRPTKSISLDLFNTAVEFFLSNTKNPE